MLNVVKKASVLAFCCGSVTTHARKNCSYAWFKNDVKRRRTKATSIYLGGLFVDEKTVTVDDFLLLCSIARLRSSAVQTLKRERQFLVSIQRLTLDRLKQQNVTNERPNENGDNKRQHTSKNMRCASIVDSTLLRAPAPPTGRMENRRSRVSDAKERSRACATFDTFRTTSARPRRNVIGAAPFVATVDEVVVAVAAVDVVDDDTVVAVDVEDDRFCRDAACFSSPFCFSRANVHGLQKNLASSSSLNRNLAPLFTTCAHCVQIFVDVIAWADVQTCVRSFCFI